ncbi:MAG: hypothetical protein U0521_19520 [Anaerolineae bacterium]
MSTNTSNIPARNSPHARIQTGLNRLWELLTAASPGIEHPVRRRQAQMLSALLLVLIGFSPITLLIIQRAAETNPGSINDASTLVVTISVVVLVASYGLSRTVHYSIAAALALVIAPLAIFCVLIVSPGHYLDLIRYLVLNLVLCGIMFSLRTTALVAITYVASSMIVMYLLIDVPSGDRLYTLIFMVMGAAVVTGFIYYRDRTEADRQRAIAAARDELRASRELYRTLAQNLPQSAVLLFDRDLRLLLAEGAALAQLGYARDKLEGGTHRNAAFRRRGRRRLPRGAGGRGAHYRAADRRAVLPRPLFACTGRKRRDHVRAGAAPEHPRAEARRSRRA